MRFEQIKKLCYEEAINKCFDEFFTKPYYKKYRHCKSRKVKQARREIIRTCLNKYNVKEIKDIYDDYFYWIAKHNYELLYTNANNN